MIQFFTKPDCPLCNAAWFVVVKVARAHGIAIEKIDISQSQAAEWRERYAEHIPVVHLDGVEVFRHQVDERRLRALLRRHGSTPGDGLHGDNAPVKDP